jgi:hypothetical protein
LFDISLGAERCDTLGLLSVLGLFCNTKHGRDERRKDLRSCEALGCIKLEKGINRFRDKRKTSIKQVRMNDDDLVS